MFQTNMKNKIKKNAVRNESNKNVEQGVQVSFLKVTRIH